MPKTIHIPADNLWDPDKEEFISVEECQITFEHSLISISKWESKWHKPFLSTTVKTSEETIDYLKCMVINYSYNPLAINIIASTPSLAKAINDYIEDPMTATTFSEDPSNKSNGKREVVTSELIYYWMTAFQIPVEFEKWHLNRLLTLIRICGIKNSPDKKMGKNSIYSQNRALNAARRKAMHSKG